MKDIISNFFEEMNNKEWDRTSFKKMCVMYFKVFKKTETDYGCSICMARVKDKLKKYINSE